MGDVPFPVEEEVEPTVADRVGDNWQSAAASAGAVVPGVSVRRAALFIVVGVALALNLPAVGIIALIILALTDQVVPL